jgi:hypothetical protein
MDAEQWADADEPAEVFVHELLHQVIQTAEVRGVELPDLHRNDAWGYGPDKGGSFRLWLSDYLAGEIPAAGKHDGTAETGAETLGLTAAVWRVLEGD